MTTRQDILALPTDRRTLGLVLCRPQKKTGIGWNVRSWLRFRRCACPNTGTADANDGLRGPPPSAAAGVPRVPDYVGASTLRMRGTEQRRNVVTHPTRLRVQQSGRRCHWFS
jgi:hypothetical protein